MASLSLSPPPAKDTGDDEAINRRCINAAPVLVARLGGGLKAAASTETMDVGVDVRDIAGVGVAAGFGSGGCCCCWG
jgi:hypothetical protein